MVNVRENYVGSLYFDDTRIKTKPVYTVLKRVFDISVSAVALTFLLPLFVIVAILIKLDSEGSVIFSQNRVGKNGNLFKVYKFRTMKTNAPHEMATANLTDPYAHITRVGRILRKTSIDELPQLFNVLRGDMSLVGPRPLIMSESDVHKLRMREGVYDVRPGVTGWAQVIRHDHFCQDRFGCHRRTGLRGRQKKLNSRAEEKNNIQHSAAVAQEKVRQSFLHWRRKGKTHTHEPKTSPSACNNIRNSHDMISSNSHKRTTLFFQYTRHKSTIKHIIRNHITK